MNNQSLFKKLGIITIAALVFWNGYLTWSLNTVKQNNGNPPTVENQPTMQQMTTTTSDFTEVIEKNISKSVGVTTKYRGQPISTGSGAIYKVANNEAIIVTNNHVIEKGDEFEVLFGNEEVRKATLIGADQFSDLAVLKVAIDFDVEAFILGDSSLSKVGEWVLAIGSPLGQDFYGTVTPGIISGKDRRIPVDLNNDGIDDWDMVVLQTSAAINPGNSGGPLINLAGELIGINSMKIAKEEVEGMAFAIPINEVITIVSQLIEHGRVIRPVLGLSGVSINEIPVYLRNYYGIGLNVEQGIYVSEIVPNGPAAAAGIMVKDIITTIDNVAISSFKEFRRQLYSKKPGDQIEIVITRGTETKTVTVTLQ